MGQFNAQNLANTMWAFAKACCWDVRSHRLLFAGLAKVAKWWLAGRGGDLGGLTPQGLANIAWAFAKGGRMTGSIGSGSGEILFAALAATVANRARLFNVQHLANTAWAFASVGRFDDLLFSSLASSA